MCLQNGANGSVIACQPHLVKLSSCFWENNSPEQAFELFALLKQGMPLQACIKEDLAKLPSTQMTSIRQTTAVIQQACQPHTQMLRQVRTKDALEQCQKPSFLSLSIAESLKEKAVLIMENFLNSSEQAQTSMVLSPLSSTVKSNSAFCNNFQSDKHESLCSVSTLCVPVVG